MDILGKDENEKPYKDESGKIKPSDVQEDKMKPADVMIDLGVGKLWFSTDEINATKLMIKRRANGITFGNLLGDDDNSELSDRLVQPGLVGIFGPARQGKTLIAQAMSDSLKIPYYRVLEPDEAFPSVNPDSLTIADVLRDIKEAYLSESDIVIIDSSRFINSIRDFGLTTAGTPMAYNIILTLLHNLAVRIGKTVLLVISAITNESVHVSLLRDMIIGSCYGVIEPSILAGGGRVSVRGGSRDFIEFKCELPHFKSVASEANDSDRDSYIAELANPIKANHAVSIRNDAQLFSMVAEEITDDELLHLDAAAYFDRYGMWPKGYVGRNNSIQRNTNDKSKER